MYVWITAYSIICRLVKILKEIKKWMNGKKLAAPSERNATPDVTNISIYRAANILQNHKYSTVSN